MSDEKVTASTEQVTEAKFDGAVADGSTLGAVEVLGGPNPMKSNPDDDSNKLKTPSQTTATPPKTTPTFNRIKIKNQKILRSEEAYTVSNTARIWSGVFPR